MGVQNNYSSAARRDSGGDRGTQHNGGSARGYLANSPRQRCRHHAHPRHDSERSLDIHAERRVPGMRAHGHDECQSACRSALRVRGPARPWWPLILHRRQSNANSWRAGLRLPNKVATFCRARPTARQAQNLRRTREPVRADIREPSRRSVRSGRCATAAADPSPHGFG